MTELKKLTRSRSGSLDSFDVRPTAPKNEKQLKRYSHIDFSSNAGREKLSHTLSEKNFISSRPLTAVEVTQKYVIPNTVNFKKSRDDYLKDFMNGKKWRNYRKLADIGPNGLGELGVATFQRVQYWMEKIFLKSLGENDTNLVLQELHHVSKYSHPNLVQMYGVTKMKQHVGLVFQDVGYSLYDYTTALNKKIKKKKRIITPKTKKKKKKKKKKIEKTENLILFRQNLKKNQNKENIDFTQEHQITKKKTIKNWVHSSCKNEKNFVISWKKKLDLTLNICSAVRYLHQKDIIHRQISPNCIFMKKPYFGLLFGYGMVETKKLIPHSPFDLDFNFLAPEMLFSEENNWEKSADIYALGITFWTIFFEQNCPFEGKSILEAMEALSNNERPKIPEHFLQRNLDNLQSPKKKKNFETITHSLFEIIEQCWNQNPEDRISVDALILLLEQTKAKYFTTKSPIQKNSPRINQKK